MATQDWQSGPAASDPSPPGSDVMLTCIAGPDRGKRFAIRTQPLLLGQSQECDVLSDDPDVAERHARFWADGLHARCQPVETATVFVDGHRVQDALLQLQQQIRIGRSIWQCADGRAPTSARFDGWLDDLSGRISSVAGVERIEGFSARDMFSEVLRSRTDEEVEEYFTVGTPATTPPLQQVETNWPKPWVFFKTFTLSVMVYLAFVFAMKEFNNPKLIPGLIMTGAFLIPVSVLIFFFEINVVRNVSLYQVVKLVLLGGVISLILSLFLFKWTDLSSWLGAMSAGIVEEVGKAAALLLVVNNLKYRWTLNGLLFGAAVGTGFSAFESAGYALLSGLNYGQEAMLNIITLRGLLSMLGLHVIWTSMVGAALWRVRGTKSFNIQMVREPQFVRVFLLAVGVHMIWNAPFTMPFYLKYIALGFVAWVVNLGLIQVGLKEIRDAQQQGRAATA